MKLEDLKNKKILILGFGVEGKSTMRFLKKFLPEQCAVDSIDQKNGPDYLRKQTHYDLVIRSPGIPKRLLTKSYTTATNIFFANTKGTIVGVTGSKGKSTTASLIYAFLKEMGLPVRLVGNIGNPMLDALSESNLEHDIFVAELSSYQLDDIAYAPHISLILNLFPEHMDYHGNVHAYWEAKKRIVSAAREKDYFIYNPGYETLIHLAKKTAAHSIPFISEIPFPESDIPLLGAHNRDNIRSAVTASLLFNISYDTMHSAIKKFKPLPHRLELVGTFKEITFYDDALSTTPESTIAAIRSLHPISTIFLGGKDRGYDFSKLASVIHSHKIPHVVLFPDSGKKILAELGAIGKKSEIIVFETNNMKEAVQFAYEKSSPGSICLLSTASPSYSIWKNFEEKGNCFQEHVRTIAKE